MNPHLHAALLIVASELMFSTMGAGVKVVSVALPPEVTVFVRNLFGLLAVAPLLLHADRGNWRTAVPHIHLLRALAGLGAMYCFFYVLGRIALADAVLLKLTAPVFLPLVALIGLGERPAATALWALPVGFAGVALVLGPGQAFSHAALVGLAGGLFAAIAKTTVRRLGRSEPAARIVFYFAVFGTLASSVPLAWSWRMPTAAEWGWLALIALAGTLAQLLMSRGYALAPAARLGPFSYSVVIFSALYGFLFWDETPTLAFAAGALLIAGAGLLALRR
ncbi:DMT family transporter [Endothiovibrio diazotrophicus]